MSEANDQAFIKISKELLCKRNDLLMLQKFQQLVNYLNHGARETLKDIRSDRIHSEEFKGISKFMALMSDVQATHDAVNELKERITKLEQLSEAYMAGRDVIQTRLQMD